jgi:hypothetical protein
MSNDGANKQINDRGLITEGSLKKGGINTTPPGPKPAPPPGQPVQPVGASTHHNSSNTDNKGAA